MNALALKIIALTAMIIDHMGAAFPETFGLWFRVVGRLAFPIYVFLIAEGFFHTKNPAKFLLRLFVFAIISEPFFDIAIKGAAIADINFLADTNIFYTLFLGGAAIVAYQLLRDKISFLAFAPLALFMWLAHALTSDYGAYGVLFIFAMYWISKKAAAPLPGGTKGGDWGTPPAEQACASTGHPASKCSLREGSAPLSDGNCVNNFLADKKLIFFALLCLWPYVDFVRFAHEFGFGVVPIQFWLMIPATLLTVLPVALYNGKRGPGGPFVKWFFYASYPVHLAVLAGLLLW